MPPRSSGSLTELAASVRAQWQGLQAGQRRTLIAVGLAAAVGLVVWASLTARGPVMAPLFTNLAPVDGAAIVAVLDHSKVPYRLTDNGQSILVPRDQVDKLRLQLAGQGLPNHGAVGLDSVLNLPFGATDFTRQVAYQKGLQGELEQTINQIHGLASSRVQVVLPQTAPFGGQSAPATAAVLVDLQPGASLDPAQVGGIAHLVAASVQGLSPNDVTVIDQTGQILWSQGAASASDSASASGVAGQAQNDLQLQQQVDAQLQQGLQHMLDQVFGPGNVMTQVNAQLNFDSGTVDKSLFQPAGSSPAVVQSMQELKQTVVGQATGATPGTAANSFPTYPAGGSGSGTSSTSDQLTQNFDVSQETDHTVVAPGTISRLSVAVVVNSSLTPAQQSLVQSTVEAAVGADPNRQDQITVVGMPFNQSLLTSLSKPPAAAKGSDLTVPMPIVIGAGAVLLLLVMAALALRRRPLPVDAGVVGTGPADGLAVTQLAADALDEPVADPLGMALATAHSQRDRMHAALRQRPEDVARVIRVWLAQDQ